VATIENIRTEIIASDDTIGGGLDSAPPLSTNQGLVGDPVRNELLACSSASVLAHPRGKVRLRSGRRDSALKSGNVVFLHSPDVTRKRVGVNKSGCFSLKSESCNVLQMPTTKRKAIPETGKAPARKRVNESLVGPDGLTLGQRVIRLMEDQGVGQSELARMCSRYYAAFVPGKEDAVKQQHIFNIIQGQESSWVTPLIAAVFDVSDMWVQFGIGNKERKKN
jgi:hypothetical protein